MALFGFGKRRTMIEQQLVDLYAQILVLTTRSEREARKTAEEWVDLARAQAEAEGTLNLTNAADAYLARAPTDPATKRILETKRADGVRDEDIRWWWNLHDLERRMMLLEDDYSRTGFVITKMRRGLTVTEAIAELRRSMPMYGDPTDTRNSSGDDRPLPFELKDRVNCWIRQQVPDPEGFKARLAKASSCNALVRSEIRAGKL